MHELPESRFLHAESFVLVGPGRKPSSYAQPTPDLLCADTSVEHLHAHLLGQPKDVPLLTAPEAYPQTFAGVEAEGGRRVVVERADARELVTRVLDNLKIGACELLVTVHDSQLLAKQKPTMTATMSTTKKMIRLISHRTLFRKREGSGCKTYGRSAFPDPFWHHRFVSHQL
jgi:hypothetical protein